MKNGYNILWTDHALNELKNTIEFLEKNWTDKELKKLAMKLEGILLLISQNPYLFPASDVNKEIRRVVILSFNTLYYRIYKHEVQIISFFSNRQSPKKRKLL